MAVSVNWATKVITVPQADMTPLGGSLYELDTNWLRLQLKDLEDDVEGMVFLDTHRHSTEVTISGVTYARFFEIINGYTVAFSPNSAYTVRLVGSNNNLADVLVLGNYSLISQNSAGLITVDSGGGGATPGQIADAVWNELVVDHISAGSTGLELASKAEPSDAMTLTPAERDAIAAAFLSAGIEPTVSLVESLRLLLATQVGKVSGAEGTTITIRDVEDTKDRVVAEVDGSGNRLNVVVDAT